MRQMVTRWEPSPQTLTNNLANITEYHESNDNITKVAGLLGNEYDVEFDDNDYDKNVSGLYCNALLNFTFS